jgi:hypothetical protein
MHALSQYSNTVIEGSTLDKQMNESNINHNRCHKFLIRIYSEQNVAVYALPRDRRKCQYLIPKDQVTNECTNIIPSEASPCSFFVTSYNDHEKHGRFTGEQLLGNCNNIPCSNHNDHK